MAHTTGVIFYLFYEKGSMYRFSVSLVKEKNAVFQLFSYRFPERSHSILCDLIFVSADKMISWDLGIFSLEIVHFIFYIFFYYFYFFVFFSYFLYFLIKNMGVYEYFFESTTPCCWLISSSFFLMQFTSTF